MPTLLAMLWGKSELWFALLWIAIYAAGNALCAELSRMVGITSCATAVCNLGMGLFLFSWIKGNGLMRRYGLCKPRLPAGKFLWYVPLAVLSSKNLWNGAALPLPVAGTVFSVCNMLGVGVMEELLFRGFLFRAASRGGVRRGVVISSAAFGLGHIVNLSGGAAPALAGTIWQVIFATAFGFLFATIFHRGQSLWPCIFTHAAFNVASVFANGTGAATAAQIPQNAAALLLAIGYTGFLSKSMTEGKAGAPPVGE